MSHSSFITCWIRRAARWATFTGLTSAAVPVWAAPLERGVVLPEATVEETRLADAVNPLGGAVTGLYGDPRGLLETPRAVSLVGPALYRERAIDGVAELVGYAPGATAPGRYGRVAVPSFRGDTGESYWGGQRRTYSLFGIFPSFNGVEAVELVRGPATVVAGVGPFSGGFVNYLPKAPSFGGPTGAVTVRVGTWIPGEPDLSHLQASVQVDLGAPVGSAAAWRLSYEGKGGDTFHRRLGVSDDRQDVYAAFSWRPRDGVTWDVNAQVLWQNTPQTNGVNRVSQHLVDTGLYPTGAAPAVGGALTGFLEPEGEVVLPLDAALFGPGDFSNAASGHVHSVVRHRAGEGVEVTHRTLLEGVNRRRYHGFEYAEWVRQVTADHRTEVAWETSAWGVPQRVTAGFALRAEWRRAWVNYFNEFIFAHDLSDPERPFSVAERYPRSYFPGAVGPGGRLFFGALAGAAETTRSRLVEAAVFWQQEARLSERWSAVVGVRGTRVEAVAEDALPAPGTRAAEDTLGAWQTGLDASVLYRPVEEALLYATVHRADETNVSVTGGGLLLFGGQLRDEDFEGATGLVEAGWKRSWMGREVFTGVAVFEQRRRRAEIGGGRNAIRVRGVEAEAAWQPGERFHARATLAWLDGRYVDSAPFQLGGRDIDGVYRPGEGPGGTGSGAGYDFLFQDQVPVGDWPLTGVPEFTASGQATWLPGGGWRVSVEVLHEGSQVGNLDGGYWIPARWLWNGSLGWERGGWSAAVDVQNLTDVRYWVHNGDTFMNNQLLTRGAPRRVDAWVKYRW